MVISFIRPPIRKGHRHDYNIYKKNHPVTPEQVINVVDLGISWYRKGFSRTNIIALPYKKKRNLDLSQEEKEYNRIHSKKRILIEHTICRYEKVQNTLQMYLETN